MIQDIFNTLLEFLCTYVVFLFFVDLDPITKRLYIYIPLSIALSIYFCLNIPHYLFLNVLLFTTVMSISFSDLAFRLRLCISLTSVFIVLSLEMIFDAFLPFSYLQTFWGSTIVNLFISVLVCVCLYLLRQRNRQNDLRIYLLKYFYLIISCLILWIIITQIYLDRLFALWQYLPGVISLSVLLLFILAIIADIHLRHSQEHKQLLLYERTHQDIEKYIDRLRKDTHDYKHQIHYIQSVINSNDDITLIRRKTNSLIQDIDSSTSISDAILAINNTLYKAVLYGVYLQCQDSSISFTFTNTPILPDFPLPDYQLVRVLENLTANALEYNQQESGLPSRFIDISLYADALENRISITNPITHFKEDVTAFYRPGYSTKDLTAHDGMGLASIQEILSNNGIAFWGKQDKDNKTITFTISYTKLTGGLNK